MKRKVKKAATKKVWILLHRSRRGAAPDYDYCIGSGRQRTKPLLRPAAARPKAIKCYWGNRNGWYRRSAARVQGMI